MKNKIQLIFSAIIILLITSCSSTKNATNLSATNGHLAGTYTITDIQTDIPAGFKITDAFDEGPYENFKGSTWDLIKNGKGNDAQFQFKKLNGEKARNVTDGYKLQIQNISSNSFIARSPVDLGGGKTGYITYTFTKS